MRGLFYSMIAVLFLMPLVLIAMSNITFNEAETNIAATKVAGGKLASFTKSIEDDMPRALDIMAKRAVTQAVIYLETNGTPFSDSSVVLEELINNGTIYGNSTDVNFTITTWTFLLADKGNKNGMDTKVSILNTKFYSLDSKYIGVDLSIGVNVSNTYSKMNVYRIFNATAAVSIEGFDDPVYTLKTNGIFKRAIRFPNLTISGVQNFDIAVGQGYYMPSPDGAGFLDRMEGRLRPSGKYNTTNATSGIETIVYLPDLQANGITIKSGQSDIDYLYFDSSTYAGYTVINSTYSWLRIDVTHAATYNISLS